MLLPSELISNEKLVSFIADFSFLVIRLHSFRDRSENFDDFLAVRVNTVKRSFFYVAAFIEQFKPIFRFVRFFIGNVHFSVKIYSVRAPLLLRLRQCLCRFSKPVLRERILSLFRKEIDKV